jgi:hypothetical protein
MQNDDQWLKIYERARELPIDVADRNVREFNYRPIPEKLKKAAARLLLPKIDLLVERRRLDKMTGEVIKALHRYRNDAYHRDKIRKETLAAAATLYFEIDCELFVSLPPSYITWSDREAWTDFLARFGLKSAYLNIPGDLEAIATSLRGQVGIATTDLAELLADHLISRVEAIQEHLEFIAENISS